MLGSVMLVSASSQAPRPSGIAGRALLTDKAGRQTYVGHWQTRQGAMAKRLLHEIMKVPTATLEPASPAYNTASAAAALWIQPQLLAMSQSLSSALHFCGCMLVLGTESPAYP